MTAGIGNFVKMAKMKKMGKVEINSTEAIPLIEDFTEASIVETSVPPKDRITTEIKSRLHDSQRDESAMILMVDQISLALHSQRLKKGQILLGSTV